MSTKTSKIMPSGKVRSPECRLAYANLFDLKEDMGGAEKYMSTLIFDEDEVDLSAMKEAAENAFKQRFGTLKGYSEDKTFRDGDEMKSESLHGYTFVRANANPDFQPRVFDQRKNPITRDTIPGIKSGDYVVTLLQPFAWEFKNKRGVSLGLDTVQLVRYGERLAAGSSSPLDELENLPIDSDLGEDDSEGML